MTAITHDRWGPNGLAVEQIVRRVSRLTDDEVRRLASAWHAWSTPDPAESPLDLGDDAPWLLASDRWNDAQDTIEAAVRVTGRRDEVVEAGRSTEAAASPRAAATWSAIWAAKTAAEVAAASDLVGTEGLTAEHLELLAGPWRSVIGDLGEPVCECVEVR